jgi:hypothetical protein
MNPEEARHALLDYDDRYGIGAVGVGRRGVKIGPTDTNLAALGLAASEVPRLVDSARPA